MECNTAYNLILVFWPPDLRKQIFVVLSHYYYDNMLQQQSETNKDFGT